MTNQNDRPKKNHKAAEWLLDNNERQHMSHNAENAFFFTYVQSNPTVLEADLGN